ncbi:MAG TPA: helix-turn-helix domain-containing protein [Rhodopila sp.]|uniref:TetR/AcrR family transcriptional regulator n=1 Tax=Rhodopila sp. TaxID=2480087 RepID=UPI002D0600C3|nr:helix-turn-helix domain-containing protein [Rhodopila sp.]HVY17917.1 helix-turn-helix domain-containing protein [Rhodopila sp.]
MTEVTTEQTGKPDRRAATHQRILEAAGRLFRAHGIDGVGVDAVMKEAGLTHGGFYAHFASKEALAAEVAQTLLRQSAERWDRISRTEDREIALERIVRGYLEPDRVVAGKCCPLTTLGPDVARRDTSRTAIRAALGGMIDALARCLPGLAARRRQRALEALSTMVGAVVLARMTDDDALARDVLDAAATSVLGRPIEPDPEQSATVSPPK